MQVFQENENDDPPPHEKKLRICIVTSSFSGTSIGGVERYLDNLTKKLQGRKDIQLYIVTVSFGKESTEIKDDITIFRKRFMNLLNKNDYVKKGKRLFQFLDKLVKKYNIDILSAENLYRSTPMPYSIAINMISFNNNIPITLRMHAFCNTELEKSILKDMMWNKLIGISKSVTENAYRTELPIEKLSTVYPRVDTEVFKLDLGKK